MTHLSISVSPHPDSRSLSIYFGHLQVSLFDQLTYSNLSIDASSLDNPQNGASSPYTLSRQCCAFRTTQHPPPYHLITRYTPWFYCQIYLPTPHTELPRTNNNPMYYIYMTHLMRPNTMVRTNIQYRIRNISLLP